MTELNLYPLKFTPLFFEKIWGGSKISSLLHKNISPLSNCGESWEISTIDEYTSIVENGFLAENTLAELIEIYMGDLVGESVYNRFGLGFPLLIKFIDAKENLSVQVHPDDTLAQKWYGENGKSELWYVMNADPGAGLYIGLKNGNGKIAYENAIKNGNIDQILQFYPVQTGDIFFIPAGAIHAIGKGVLLAEIQQASDITYRIFDWNRTDDQGNKRPLHIQESLMAADFSPNQQYKIEYKETKNISVKILRESCFHLNVLYFDKPMQKIYEPIDSFVIYICTKGEARFLGAGIDEHLKTGETLLLPAEIAELHLIPAPEATLLEVYIN